MALTDITRSTDVSMNTDLYELTMAQGLWENGKLGEQGCFTAFFREAPFGSVYAVMCGTAELGEFVETSGSRMRTSRIWPSLRLRVAVPCSNPAFSSSCAAFVRRWISTPSPRASLCSRASPWCA